jgi:hypothetical protein
MLFALLLGHCVADFPLQTEWIAKYKNWKNASPPPPGQKQQAVWPYVMSAHAGTHAAAVWVVTGSPLLAGLEFVAHWAIDALKCANVTDIHKDQVLHYICKSSWVLLYMAGIR